eukprot:351342-Chlamydomonas_euryale.AAC.1
MRCAASSMCSASCSEEGPEERHGERHQRAARMGRWRYGRTPAGCTAAGGQVVLLGRGMKTSADGCALHREKECKQRPGSKRCNSHESSPAHPPSDARACCQSPCALIVHMPARNHARTCRLFIAQYSMPMPSTGVCRPGNRRAAVRYAVMACAPHVQTHAAWAGLASPTHASHAAWAGLASPTHASHAAWAGLASPTHASHAAWAGLASPTHASHAARAELASPTHASHAACIYALGFMPTHTHAPHWVDTLELSSLAAAPAQQEGSIMGVHQPMRR